MPIRNVEDEMFWKFTENTLKTACLLQLSLISDQGLGENQSRFEKWGKVWGLGLLPKFKLVIWKVLHRILAVKDALLKRNINVESGCPLCEKEVEMVEHLFFSVLLLKDCGGRPIWALILMWVFLSFLGNGLRSGFWRHRVKS